MVRHENCGRCDWHGPVNFDGGIRSHVVFVEAEGRVVQQTPRSICDGSHEPPRLWGRSPKE